MSFVLLATLTTLRTINGALIIISHTSATEFSRAGSSPHPGWAVTGWHPWDSINAQTSTGVCTVSMAPAMRTFPIPARKEQTRWFTRPNSRVWVRVCHHRSFSDQTVSLNTPLTGDENQQHSFLFRSQIIFSFHSFSCWWDFLEDLQTPCDIWY